MPYGLTRKGLDVRDGTLNATGRPSGSADALLVCHVFHHVSDYEGAVEELARIGDSGGASLLHGARADVRPIDYGLAYVFHPAAKLERGRAVPLRSHET